MSKPLWVVMPVFNEASAIARVIEEWVPVLRLHAGDFVFCVINDGSRDATLSILKALATGIPELRIEDKPNSGHGQTCVYGYRLALEEGAQWLLQVDSDGQCEASSFPEFWTLRESHAAIFGYRGWDRADGWKRHLISSVLRLVVGCASGAWLKDCNVPYRLMRRTVLEPSCARVPGEFHLANVLVAVLLQKDCGIHWVKIGFRDRLGGRSSVRGWSFLRRGWQLYRQLREHRRLSPAKGP